MYEISNGESITPVDVLKDLGVTMSSGLSWSTHISSITMRASSVAAWVFSVFRGNASKYLITYTMAECTWRMESFWELGNNENKKIGFWQLGNDENNKIGF